MTRSKDPTALQESPRQPRPEEPPPHDGIGDGPPDLLLVIDPAASIREISPSVRRLLAYRRGQLLGTSFLEILHPDDEPVLRSLMSVGQEKGARLRARHADGDWRSFEVSARGVPGPDRKPLFVIEARDMKGGEPRLPAPPAMQLGGPFAPPADLVSTGEFPACEGLPAGERAADPELIERAGGRGETVLVVLDDPKASAQACSIMRALGYNVLEAMSPADAEGFARVHKGAMDLLVADLATPRVRGRAFVRSMQAIRPGLKSLFVSCQRYGSLAERRVFESGARLLHEPFTPEELAHAVRRALEGPKD